MRKTIQYLLMLIIFLQYTSCFVYSNESYRESTSFKKGIWYRYKVLAQISHRVYEKPAKKDVSLQYFSIQNFDGQTIRLNTSDTPQLYLDRCDSGPNSDLVCIFQIMTWGVFLLELSDRKSALADDRLLPSENALNLSTVFLEFAFQKLTDRLNQYQAGSKKWIDEYRQQSALLKKSYFYKYSESLPLSVKIINTKYSVLAWRHLPKDNNINWLFYENVRLCEELKDSIYHVNARAKDFGTTEHIKATIKFYSSALNFHRKHGPVPVEGQLVYIAATFGGTVNMPGTGYSLQPDPSKGLRPVKELALNDLAKLEMLTAALQKKGALSKSQAKQRNKEYEKQYIDIELEDRNFWIRHLRIDQDLFSLAEQLVERAAFSFDKGKIGATEKDLLEALNIFHRIGATREWAITSIKTSSFYYHQDQYEIALQKINPAIPSLISSFGFGKTDSLIKALNLKWKALRKLNKTDEKRQFEAEYSNKLKRLIESGKPVSDELERIERIPDLSEKKQKLFKLLHRYESDIFWSTYIKSKILDSLKAQAKLEETVEFANRLRPELRKIYGIKSELQILELLLETHYKSGEFADFLSTLSEYEYHGKKAHGENWMIPFESMLARVYYSLEEYEKALSILELKEKRRKRELLKYPDNSDEDPDLRDLLLSARIQLALGNKEQSLAMIEKAGRQAKIWASEGTGILVRYKETGDDVLLEIGEIYLALGMVDKSLKIFEGISNSRNPENHLDTWVAATVKSERIRIQQGRPLQQGIPRILNLVNSIQQFPEFNQLNAVLLLKMVAEHYKVNQNYRLAGKYYSDALALANTLGSLEEAIEINRSVGDLWSMNGDLDKAAKYYRKSVILLGSVSERIPSHTSKVGYREERAKAIPLLVATNYKQYEKTKNPIHLKSLLWAVEQGKNRSLVEIVASGLAAQSADIKNLRKALSPHQELLIYYNGSQNETYRIHLSHSVLDVMVLNMGTKEIDKKLLQLRSIVTTGEPIDQHDFKHNAKKLASILLPDAIRKKQVLKKKSILIVPTGAMNLVPVSILVDDENHYIAERKDLNFSYLPSATLLLNKQTHPPCKIKTVAYINPSQELQHHLILLDKPTLASQLKYELNRLGPTQFYMEQSRTPEQFLKEINTAEDVFIYTHARFQTANPMESYIRLASDLKNSGKLTASDIARQKLNNTTWVLAGCSTGKSHVRMSDEVLGLPRALLIAGVKTVVISLWDVNAASSFELMNNFYSEIGKGATPSEALHVSSAQMKNAGSDIYDWAPFIVVGSR